MFMLKSTHAAEIARLEQAYLEAQASHIRLIDAKDAQIADLRRLVFIPTRETNRDELEADSIMSVSEKPIDMSEKERNEILEGSRELDLLVSGNYDTELLQ